VFALIGVLASLWTAKDMIAMTLRVNWLRLSGEGGGEGATMNLSGLCWQSCWRLSDWRFWLLGRFG